MLCKVAAPKKRFNKTFKNSELAVNTNTHVRPNAFTHTCMHAVFMRRSWCGSDASIYAEVRNSVCFREALDITQNQE